MSGSFQVASLGGSQVPADQLSVPPQEPYTYADRVANTIIGAQLAAQDEGARSFSDRILDIPTKFVPLTGAAIFNSFANTAIDVGNMLGADFHRFTIEDEFGPDSETTKYYQKNAGMVEGTALAVGSLLPGLAGIKVLKMAQLGSFGKTFQTATSLFSGIQKEAMAAATADAVGNGTGASLFGMSRLNTIKAIAAGVGEQALQGAVYETATLATMHASPITDNNTWKDNIADVASAAYGFGLFGGLIDGASTYYKIKKATQAADIATKGQELFGSLGKGNINPGDRVLNLYSVFDSIQQGESRLAKMKYNLTENTTQKQIRQQFIEAAGKDEELAGAFHNFIERGRAAGLLTEEELSNQLGGLKKLGRYDGLEITSKPDSVFYINSKIDPANLNFITHDDLLTRSATGEAATSRAFELTSPTQLPTIAHANEMLEVPAIGTNGVIKTAKYTGVSDAYSKGVDIFIDAKGGVHVNTDSTVFKEVPRPGMNRVLTKAERDHYVKFGRLPEGSAPLEGIGTTLDVETGKLYRDTAPPAVLGDFGKPKLDRSGTIITAGDKSFSFRPGQEFTPLVLEPLEANSRFVWAAERGIKAGDSIHPTDLPLLEQAWRELAAGNNAIEGRGIATFSDGTAIPKTADSMLAHIRQTKQLMYGDLLSEGKNADEISRLLNAPTKGLTNNFNSVNPAELMFAPESSQSIRHIRLAYDIGNIKDQEGNFLRGMQGVAYRMKVAADTNTNTVANFLGKYFPGLKSENYLHALQFTKGAQDADIMGAGNGFLGNANANYGTLGQQAERMGRATSELMITARGRISDALSPSTNLLKRNFAVSAEVSNMETVAHSTGEHWLLPSAEQLKAWGLPRNTMVLEGAVSANKKGELVWNQNYLPKGFSSGAILKEGETTATHGAPIVTSKGISLQNLYTLSDNAAEFLRAHRSLTNERNGFRQDFNKAQGLTKPEYPADRVYFPPIDTSRYPYIAYVRQREGYMLGESGASVITARSAEELQEKIRLLGPEYDAFTKKGIGDHKKALGEYEADRNFAHNPVKSELARKGILNNIVPDTRPQNIVDRFVNWHFKQSDTLIRDHVELYNAATFAQLEAMGTRFAETGASQVNFITPFTQRTATNPYNSYIRTALGLSAKDEHPLWQLAQEKLQAFGDKAFNATREAFGAATKGLLPFEDAAKVSERFGLGNPYGSAIDSLAKASYYGGLANQLPEPRLLSKFVGTANTIIGATVIRLDALQQLVDAITLPITVALEHSPATRELQKLAMLSAPGVEQKVPGYTKTLYNAIRNYFTDDGKLLDLYTKAAGLTKDELSTYRRMIDDLTLPLGKLSEEGWAQKIDGATRKAEVLAGTKFTNKFLHFVAADVGRQIGEASGLKGVELLDAIGTFTNRVSGNLAAGQRAAIFSGPVGQAVGLFQSFQWNLMQQLLRHIGEGDVKAMAMAAGLQTSIFGLSSLPGFRTLNTLIAERHGNTTGESIDTGLTGLLGKDVADYLLYGAASGLLGWSLYDRGDLNIRRATVLPVNPLEFPSVAAGMRVYQNLARLENNLTTQGASVPASLLLALEHNSLSRPLGGLAQMMQGYSTDSRGNLIATTSGLNDMSGISEMSRLLGARPLDEAIAMEAMRRKTALEIRDSARLAELGVAARTAMYSGATVSPQQVEDFMSAYVKAGGNQENFNAWFLQTSKKANSAAINMAMENFGNPRSVMLQRMMGGVPLPDVYYRPNIQAATVDAARQTAMNPQLE